MFIYQKKNILNRDICNSFISLFENSDEKRPGVLYGPNGVSSDSEKKSTDITFNPKYLQHPSWGPLLIEVVSVLEKGLSNYIDRNKIAFSKLDPLYISPNFNMQRYEPGEGFYGWHCERASLKYSNRVLVWAIYLNDVADRGETEFLYQQHFEEAEAGKLVIWPSDWMYTHRGVPSPTQRKYILTGWFDFIPKNESN